MTCELKHLHKSIKYQLHQITALIWHLRDENIYADERQATLDETLASTKRINVSVEQLVETITHTEGDK